MRTSAADYGGRTGPRAGLDALAKGDIESLRRMAGKAGVWQFDRDDPTAAKEALKSLRDGQPLHVEIARGLLDDEHAILWVEGVDRDEIRRRGRLLMRRAEGAWRYADSNLDSVDE